jgi:hypothetical protein
MQFPLPVACVMLWFWRQKKPAKPQHATLTQKDSYNNHDVNYRYIPYMIDISTIIKTILQSK